MKMKSLLLSVYLLISANAYGSLELAYPHRFYFGLEFLNLSLHNHIDNVQINGSRFFSGLRFGYEYLKPCAFYAGVDLLGAGCDADFKAHLDDEELSWQKADRGFGNIELRLGYTFFKCFCNNNLLMTPFLGLGMYNIYPIDHHNDQGYREDLPYFAGGLRLRYALCYAIDVGINAKIIQAFGSERKFKLVTNTVKSHHNFCSGEIGIPIIWHLGCTQRWDFQFEPYFLRISNNIFGLRTLFGYRF